MTSAFILITHVHHLGFQEINTPFDRECRPRVLSQSAKITVGEGGPRVTYCAVLILPNAIRAVAARPPAVVPLLDANAETPIFPTSGSAGLVATNKRKKGPVVGLLHSA